MKPISAPPRNAKKSRRHDGREAAKKNAASPQTRNATLGVWEFFVIASVEKTGEKAITPAASSA